MQFNLLVFVGAHFSRAALEFNGLLQKHYSFASRYS